jgi:hypothetical protein
MVKLLEVLVRDSQFLANWCNCVGMTEFEVVAGSAVWLILC